MGSQWLIGSFPPGTARGPNPGLFASNRFLPSTVSGGASLLSDCDLLLISQTPFKSCSGAAAAGAASFAAPDAGRICACAAGDNASTPKRTITELTDMIEPIL